MAPDAVWLGSVDSTNEEAKRRARAGAAGPLWIAARVQTAGRGRRGRAWDSAPGNLFCTLLLTPDWDAARSAQLAFAAGLAMAETAESWLPPEIVSLKWPNDLLVAGRKAGGCLLEAGEEGAGRGRWLAIGVGLNLRAAPDGAPFPATHFAAHMRGIAPPAPETALDILAVSFDRWLTRWRAEGFAPMREAFLARAAGLGASVTARLADGSEQAGAFEGLDADGALLLRTPDGHLRTIAAADIFFGPAPRADFS